MTVLRMTKEEYEKQYGQKPGTSFSSTTRTPFQQPTKPTLPLLTKDTGGFGTALKDVAVGAGKSFIRGGRDVAGLAQSAGKGIMGLFGADTSQLGIKSIDESTPEGAQVSEQLKSKSRGEQIGGVLETVAELGAGFATKEAQAGIRAYKAAKEARAGERVTEIIRPKPTIKEAQLAQKEGRFVEGKEPTWFRKGTEDKILPSTKTISARDTIIQKIPNASKMKPAELYKAVDSEITKTAENLRPQMKATPVKPETIQKINTDWEKVKKLQLEAADATEEANVLKLQKQFEERLRKSGAGSHDDLWETAIEYDKSIPDAVKKANSLSDASLQAKKDIWLQNRAILRDAINDNAYGMGEVSQKAFSEMSNLYEAKNGILSQTKVDKAQASKLKQLMKNHPEITGALKLTLGAEAVRRILGINIP